MSDKVENKTINVSNLYELDKLVSFIIDQIKSAYRDISGDDIPDWIEIEATIDGIYIELPYYPSKVVVVIREV